MNRILDYFKKLNEVKDVWFIILAFLFSIAGDWFLSNMNENANWFVIGIALFFVAHIGYLLFALLNGKVKWLFTTILVVAFLVFYFVVLFPSINENVLKLAVLIYLLISCFSLGAAAGIKSKPVVLYAYIFGIFLILFSDTIISLKEFVGYNNLNFLILPTYYVAHISITFSLIIKELDLKSIN